uniref:Uncharacterized protein n=1 Tax=Eiseniibacteriota bacterium TaxID=2212470 RepID=A0A832I0K2_UNCEI
MRIGRLALPAGERAPGREVARPVAGGSMGARGLSLARDADADGHSRTARRDVRYLLEGCG